MSAAADASTAPASSAAVDSTPTSTPAGDASRLQQPTDAVAMESIPDSTATTTDRKDPVEPTAAGANADASITPQHQQADTAITSGAEPDAAPATAGGLRDRSDSIMAIGPAQDDIKAMAGGADDGPVCNITLLLTSGSRHPYRISGKYLSRRNVPIPEENESGQPDPFSISIYTLKELILREWRNDWETKPASPSSIRLIHFGKLLDDKEPLKKYQFSPESPNVVHMSIRPQDLDEEEPKAGAKNSTHGGADGQRQRSGGCCVVL